MSYGYRKKVYIQELLSHIEETINALENLKENSVLENIYKTRTAMNFFLKYKSEIFTLQKNIKWFVIAFKGIGYRNPLYPGVFNFHFIGSLNQVAERFDNVIEDGLRVILESDSRTTTKMKKIEYNVGSILFEPFMSIDTTLAEFYTLQNYLMTIKDFTTEENVLKVFGLDDYDKRFIETEKDDENFFVKYLVPNYPTGTYRIYEAHLNYGTFEIGTSQGSVKRFDDLKKIKILSAFDTELEKTLGTDLYPENFV